MIPIAHNNINNGQQGTVNVGGNRNPRGGNMNNNNNQNNNGTSVPPTVTNTQPVIDWTKIGVISTLISTCVIAFAGAIFWFGTYYAKAEYTKEKITEIDGSYVTKKDLGNLATKDDLSKLVTKEDIKDMATNKNVGEKIQIIIDMLNSKK